MTDDAATAAPGEPAKAAASDRGECHRDQLQQPRSPFEFVPAGSPEKAAKEPKAAAKSRKPPKTAAAAKKAGVKGQAATTTTRAKAVSAAEEADSGAGTGAAVALARIAGSKRKATADSHQTKQQPQHNAKSKAAAAGTGDAPAELRLHKKQHAGGGSDDEDVATEDKGSGLLPEDGFPPAHAPEADPQHNMAAQQPAAKQADIRKQQQQVWAATDSGVEPDRPTVWTARAVVDDDAAAAAAAAAGAGGQDNRATGRAARMSKTKVSWALYTDG
jgi:hypothetical protein